jgi:hypothetical protein
MSIFYSSFELRYWILALKLHEFFLFIQAGMTYTLRDVPARSGFG